jgi:hypothetical protein
MQKTMERRTQRVDTMTTTSEYLDQQMENNLNREDIANTLDLEVKWAQDQGHLSMTSNYREGYIDGLRQAKHLLLTQRGPSMSSVDFKHARRHVENRTRNFGSSSDLERIIESLLNRE